MTKPRIKPPSRRVPKADRWKEIIRLIRKNKTFLITTHVNPDGDGLGAQSALYSALRQLDKKVLVVNHDHLPKRFEYLPFSGVYQVSDVIPPHDVCFVLDAGDFSRIREGVKREEFGVLVNIDHHYSNDLYGDYNVVLPESPATGEVVYGLIKALKVKIDKGIAESVYTSIVTDTGRFRYSNTTPQVLHLAAELVEKGVDVEKVSDRIFTGISKEATELVRMALATVKLYDNGTIASMTLNLDDFKKSGALEEDTDNLINFVRNLNQVRIAIFLKERSDGQIKLSLRTRQQTNAANIAKLFGGGGHSYAAGATMEGPIEKALKKVLTACQSALK